MAAYFDHLQAYLLAVCKECRHGVLPSHIESHLARAHKVHRKEAGLVADQVSSWTGLVQYASDVQVPDIVVEPISQLPVYTDGLLCRVDPRRCRQVFRSARVMKNHWRKAHDWSPAARGGRPSRLAEREIQQRSKEACKTVCCQRLLVQGPGSQYFEVHPPAADMEAVPVNGDAAWARIGDAMAEAWANVEKLAQTTIQAGKRDEVNPWLERTGWLPYLVGLERPDLLASMEEPNSDPNKNEETIEAAIWKAMDDLARISQASVINRIGVFVRLEAIRTEKHQTRYQPLQPYMDEKSIVKHARPWKQMLMFFARTQRAHEWKSPKYRFTRRQREAWEAVVDQAEREVEGEEMDVAENHDESDDDGEQGEADESRQEGNSQPAELSRMQKACLQFCIELLNQSITRKEYDSPLVCALAVLGVKEDGWKGPEQYPPILSAVIKVARFMVVQQALELSDPFDDDGDSAYESDDASSPPRRRPKGCLQFVQEMMDKFMVRGCHSPMQWMLDLRTYGLKVHYNTTSRGHVEWTGPDELLYKDLHFTMAQFRSMIHGLRTESRRLLMEELLFCNRRDAPQIPSIPWDQLRDNPTDERPGWNFLKDHRTRLPVDGERWLFDRVGQDAAIRSRFVKPGARSGMDRQEVERYMDRVVEFREKLIVLMHIAGGQPGRGPEILSVRHSNTVQGGHRNIFIEDGMVVYVTRYHKGYAVSGDVKVIHRYLPREVGELLVWYLWLVLPFQQRLEAMVWEKETISSHLWPADPSGRKWTTDRLREMLKRESRVGLGQALTAQAYREIAIGISRRFMRRSTAFIAGDSDESCEWDEEKMAAAIADEQAGHSPHIAGMIYARGIMEQAGAVADKRQQFRMSSTDWHRFLGFQSVANEAYTCKKRKRAPFESEADEGRIERWGRLRKMDTEAQLKRMMGDKAAFRGVQKEAMEGIVAGESPVVAVMPTGAGKSLLFMLPAWAEQGGTTVVVVPLVALRGDMMRRCRQLGISCAEWEGRHPPDAAAVVLVTPESAVGEDFTTFLNRLRATRQLDRIVIDECHIVLNRRYTFRKQMQQLGKLVAAETQMVLLSATLPPTEEDELFRRMHFTRDQVKMHRAPTTRTNVAYRVVRVGRVVKKKELEAMVAGVVAQKGRKFKTGKIVIYGNSVPKVKALAARLGCNAYYHDAVGKAEILADFMAGKQRVIVATSALGMGVDIPDIRCIIHMDWPRTILDYAQESGRAGRDGLRSEAIVIGQEGDAGQGGDEQTAEEQKLVEAYVGGEGVSAICRRRVLDKYLDGREGRVGCEEGEEGCDVCRAVGEETDEESGEGDSNDELDEEGEESDEGSGSGNGLEEEEEEIRRVFEQQERERQGPRERVVQGRQQEFGEVEWLRRQLAQWANRCGLCEAAGQGQSGHDIRRCWRPESGVAKEMITAMEEIKFEAYSGCFWCGVPQEICNGWESNGQGRCRRVQGVDCQYKGVLVGGLVGLVAGDEGILERWRVRLAGLGILGTDKGLIGYLGFKQRLEVVESNCLVKEFCWVTRLKVGING